MALGHIGSTYGWRIRLLSCPSSGRWSRIRRDMPRWFLLTSACSIRSELKHATTIKYSFTVTSWSRSTYRRPAISYQPELWTTIPSPITDPIETSRRGYTAYTAYRDATRYSLQLSTVSIVYSLQVLFPKKIPLVLKLRKKSYFRFQSVFYGSGNTQGNYNYNGYTTVQ